LRVVEADLGDGKPQGLERRKVGAETPVPNKNPTLGFHREQLPSVVLNSFLFRMVFVFGNEHRRTPGLAVMAR
jgi:hypothetical protein